MKTLTALLLFLLPLSLFGRSPVTNPAQGSLVFIENKGQITDQFLHTRNDIQFKLNAGPMNIFIGSGGLHYQWSKPGVKNNSDNAAAEIETYRLDVNLQGANPHAAIETEEAADYYENYYLPQTPDGVTAHSCRKVTYKNIYPGIDWVLYIGKSEVLKYDFIVHEGADVKQLQLKYSGATKLVLNDGAMKAETPFGNITEQAPYAYEAVSKKQVPAAYVLKDYLLSFDIANSKEAIVIDPQIDWATYYGGELAEDVLCTLTYTTTFQQKPIAVSFGFSKTLQVDTLGNVYMIGNSVSNTNIATLGAHQSSRVGSIDGFLVKFSAPGQRQWATYYGGASVDYFSSLALKGADIYVSGQTKSTTGIATAGSFKSSVLPGSAPRNAVGFLVRFNVSGQRQWATYYGSDNSAVYDFTRLEDVIIDVDDNIYVAGHTTSRTGMATTGSFQDTMAAVTANGACIFLAKFDQAGQRLWGTYYGSTDTFADNRSCRLATDVRSNLFIAGSCSIISGLATAGAYKTTGDNADCYLARFDKNGQRKWGTYFGGTNYDFLGAIACDDKGYIYMAGSTNSKNGISKPGSFQSSLYPSSGFSLSENGDGFIEKFDTAGTWQWGSYFGGENFDGFYNIDIDRSGDIGLTGMTVSDTNIATGGSWKSKKTDIIDGMFVKFDQDGQRLWATYYGGEKYDKLVDLVSDRSNNVYLCGTTHSLAGIATAGSHQPAYADTSTTNSFLGGNDMFVVKTNPDSVVYLQQPIDTILCKNSAGIHFRLGYIVSKSFRKTNVFRAELSDINGSFASPTVIGSVAASASGFINCSLPVTTTFGKGYRVRVVATAPFYASNDNGIDITVQQGPEKPVATGDTLLCSGSQLQLSATCNTAGVAYNWIGPNGFISNLQSANRNNISLIDSGNYIVTVSPAECKMMDTVHLAVKRAPAKPKITQNTPICEGDTIIFSYEKDTSAATFYGLTWPNPHAIVEDNLIKDIAKPAYQGQYIVIATNSICMAIDTTYLVIKPLPVPDAGSNSPVLVGHDIRLLAKGDTVTGFVWEGVNGFSSMERSPVIEKAGYEAEGVYIVTATRDGCIATDTTEVIIDDKGDDVFVLYPNPNNGSFTIKGSVQAKQEIPMKVVNDLGQEIYTDKQTTFRKTLNRRIVLPAVANGFYYFYLRADTKTICIPFVVGK